MTIRLALFFGFGVAAACAAPCTTPDCTEWVVLNPAPARSLIFRTHPLEIRNEAITRALIMVHGQGRNADDYFRTAVAAGFLAGRLDDTVIIAPKIASNDRSCSDTLAVNEVNWRCSGDSWRSGASAVRNDALTSYDFADALLRKLATKSVFPNLGAIVIAGHSAGGQYVARYAMSNQVHETLGVPVYYVVSNPSSYAYLDPERPSAGTGEMRPYAEGRNCTTYDNWPYGLQNRTGYAAKLSEDQLKKQLGSRSVTYLLGELDTMPLAGFDGSCPAMAQGPNRLARGQAYARYLNEKYGAGHTVTTVPLCGHNARCIFTADVALPVVFPKLAESDAR
jgi:pimeloyl-ACP methyl ester carboxylesterase